MGERDALPPLPLALGPPHLIPPAPTRDPRAIAFLPDLVGLPWVAYAAGSFLVVSHLPSPSRDDNSNVSCSPFFRQVIDLRAPVSAVAWCGSGSGEVAAAAENSVSVFQPAPTSSPGLLLCPTPQIILAARQLSLDGCCGTAQCLEIGICRFVWLAPEMVYHRDVRHHRCLLDWLRQWHCGSWLRCFHVDQIGVLLAAHLEVYAAGAASTCLHYLLRAGSCRDRGSSCSS